MTQLEDNEKELIRNELVELSKKINNDISADLTSITNQLNELFQDTSFGYQECETIKNLNKQVQTLEQDTNELCNTLKTMVEHPEYY